MSFDRICFDFDSTLSRIEGIDELAKRAGLGPEMARLTDAAMNGEVPLEAIYERRLALIKPDRQAIDWLAELYLREIVEGVAEVFGALLAQGKAVYIISGGLRQAIEPMARWLNLPASHVHAVDIVFNADGSYRDFDQDCVLAKAGGKAQICRQLSHPQQTLAMIGDGNTDLEAKQAGAYFIGFGGVVERPIVRAHADFFIADTSLLPVLDVLL
ncbi:MAG: haloacid dehalogenase [Gammaproteobacteria bacterium HGW-Gammaproteobacteria-3]|nr:MAG: haloacid dehalogenase [Gammaproteobacteria bacterium HGW-Gammaproteobacteria-3]